MESYSICHFVSSLRSVVQCLQGLSMLWQVSEFNSFLRLNNIPLQVYTTFCVFAHLTMDSCFHLLAIVDIAAVNMRVQIVCSSLCF